MIKETLGVARAVAWRSVHLTFTNPALLLPSVIFPLIFYVAFAGGLSNVANTPGFDYPAGYDTFQFAFVLTQASAFAGVFTGFGMAADFERGFTRRLMLAAPRREGVVLGYIGGALTRATFTGLLLTIVALVCGMRPTGSVGGVLGLVLLSWLVCLAAALFAGGVAMRLKTLQAGPAMQMPVFVLLFLAPVFVPLDLVGGWVHDVATVNPMTAILEGARDFLSGGDADLVLIYGVALGLVSVFGLWSLRSLRSAERTGA